MTAFLERAPRSSFSTFICVNYKAVKVHEQITKV